MDNTLNCSIGWNKALYGIGFDNGRTERADVNLMTATNQARTKMTLMDFANITSCGHKGFVAGMEAEDLLIRKRGGDTLSMLNDTASASLKPKAK